MNKLRKVRTLALASTLIILGQGCITTSGGFGEFYQSETDEQYPATQAVRIYRFSPDSLQALRYDGYTVIGQANFTGPLADKLQAITQAQKVGAQVVLLNIRLIGTSQTAIPVTDYHAPQTTMIQSSGSASGSAYGSGGYAFGTANGYSTSYATTPGYTTTQFIPMTIETYEHSAIFFRKVDDHTQVPAKKQQPVPSDDRRIITEPQGSFNNDELRSLSRRKYGY